MKFNVCRYTVTLETTEDIIHIDELEYESLLAAAAANLSLFVSAFDPQDIGFSNDFKNAVCPQSEQDFLNCLSNEAEGMVDKFYQG